jgi:hypothetical protein
MLRVARFDGGSILILAGGFALGSASLHDVPGTAISLMVAGAGAIELHGAGLLRHGEERGLRWLVTSQVYLMVVMLGLVASKLGHIDTTAMRVLLTDDARAAIAQDGLTVDEFLHMAYVFGYGSVGAATVLYQGGMAIYYARRRTAVAAALGRD